MCVCCLKSLLFVFLLLLSLSNGSDFHLTVTSADDVGLECHANLERFKKGVRCCHDTTGNDGIANTCTSTNGSECLTDMFDENLYRLTVDYDQAYDLCQSIGYRLCTVEEYYRLCIFTGCGGNTAEVWVSQPCIASYYTVNH